jgi:hypothetical protein
MHAGWTGAAGSVAAWLVVAVAAAGYRRVARRGGVRPAAAALALLGISASVFTVATALGWAFPGGGLDIARYVAVATGAVGLALFIAAAFVRSRGSS